MVRAAVLAELRERGRWLLVFDNAEDPADIDRVAAGRRRACADHLPRAGWAEVAVPVEVDVLARAESVAILQDRVTGLGDG